MIKLNRQQTEEALRNPEGIECHGDGTDKKFIIIDAEELRHLRESLWQQGTEEGSGAVCTSALNR